jgi:hypothetical protein
MRAVALSALAVLGGQYLDWAFGLRVGVFSTLATIALWAYKLSRPEPGLRPQTPAPAREEEDDPLAPGWAARWK